MVSAHIIAISDGSLRHKEVISTVIKLVSVRVMVPASQSSFFVPAGLALRRFQHMVLEQMDREVDTQSNQSLTATQRSLSGDQYQAGVCSKDRC